MFLRVSLNVSRVPPEKKLENVWMLGRYEVA